MLYRLNHIAFAVADPERSARLFEKLFDAQVVLPGHGHRGPPEVCAQLQDLRLVFVQGHGSGSNQPLAHVALTITEAELASSKHRLTGLGLRFEEPRNGPPGRALYFLDYDNYLFELCVEG